MTEENQKNEEQTKPQNIGTPVIPSQPTASSTPSTPPVEPATPENDEAVEVAPADPNAPLTANQRRWGGELYEKTAEDGWRKVK